MELTKEVLEELLKYDQLTGQLLWKERKNHWFKSERDCKAWNTRYAGKEAFTSSSNGYRQGTILGKRCLAHKIIYILMGEATVLVDHTNRNREDNSWNNLRESSISQNAKNMSTRRDNKSGYSGIYWRKDMSKWCVQIFENSVRKNVAFVSDINEAIKIKMTEEKRMAYLKPELDWIE